MLELSQITKDYPAGEDTVHALKGVSIQFRSSEFVSILGPSGCGKTTLLNIIGGLDKYTTGDLIINGKSTKEFKDRDWDTYRNHSIGFVFQSYNLIPHQTVLQNVEIALTLSGVGKAERKERAIKALEQVGLGNQLNKKPSQMSGGQMQRVAIARALVNNPDIILADEPTGALDTETSVQVMEILKEISQNRLIVMVTHNPELAEQYSSRIIRMLDGKVIDDSSPLTETESEQEQANDKEKIKHEKEELQTKGKKANKKPSMSFFTALKLSLKNLFTKRGRTVLTSFAGSIGIIGIALILAVSQGTTGYIEHIEEETLTTYPITIEATATDIDSLLESFMSLNESNSNHANDAVYKKSLIYKMANAIAGTQSNENDLKSFKSYLEAETAKENSQLSKAIAGLQYSYGLDLLMYTENTDGKIIESNIDKLFSELMEQYLGTGSSTSSGGIPSTDNMPFSSMSPIASNMWQEMLPGDNGAPINDLLKNQYDVVYGAWPNDYDEIVLILDKNNEIDDISLYMLGLLGQEVIDDVVGAIKNGTEIKEVDMQWSYQDICGKECRTILNSDCFTKNENGQWIDLRESETGLKYLYDRATKLKITGIIRPNENAEFTMMKGTIGYTSALTKYVVDHAEKSDIVKAQKASPNIDIFTGRPFKSSSDKLSAVEKETEFRSYINNLGAAGKAETYVKIKSVMPKEQLKTQTDNMLATLSRKAIMQMISDNMVAQMGVNAEQLTEYLSQKTDAELKELIRPGVEEQIKVMYAEQVAGKLSALSVNDKANALEAELSTYTTDNCALYYDEVITFSNSTYEQNLINMGCVDLDSPVIINIYASSFENKDLITQAISNYNKSVTEEKQIKYTDYVGLMMSSVTQIINAVTYVLIAFVAISLVVSSIMVGVITLISVQERTKEIGILRAIGASKNNVSSMFNAETLIIGFTSGLVGVLITYLLCIPINLILHALTGIGALKAFLDPVAALILIAISMVLTLLSGLIPSRSAAKKDPVVALRTE